MWRVMIADDEPYIREGLEKLIPWEELGCELIYVAENGQDLLEQIRSCPPDIAIIDIKMPLMDGMEVAEYIYKNHIRTSVIFLTAYADFQYARKAIQYQVSDYIVKTAALEEIPAAIANIKQRLESENMTWYRMLLVTPVRQGEKVPFIRLNTVLFHPERRKKDWCLQSMTVNGRRKSSVVVRK